MVCQAPIMPWQTMPNFDDGMANYAMAREGLAKYGIVGMAEPRPTAPPRLLPPRKILPPAQRCPPHQIEPD